MRQRRLRLGFLVTCFEAYCDNILIVSQLRKPNIHNVSPNFSQPVIKRPQLNADRQPPLYGGCAMRGGRRGGGRQRVMALLWPHLRCNVHAACTDSTPRRRRRHLPALHGQHYNRSYRRFKSLGLGASIYYVHTYLEEGAGPKEL